VVGDNLLTDVIPAIDCGFKAVFIGTIKELSTDFYSINDIYSLGDFL